MELNEHRFDKDTFFGFLVVITLILFGFCLGRITAHGQERINPTDLPWCDEVKVIERCYDGISYAYLIEKNIALEDYPKNEIEFLLIKDSFESQ